MNLLGVPVQVSQSWLEWSLLGFAPQSSQVKARQDADTVGAQLQMAAVCSAMQKQHHRCLHLEWQHFESLCLDKHSQLSVAAAAADAAIQKTKLCFDSQQVFVLQAMSYAADQLDQPFADS